MTTILGISAFYHDSAAALVRDGVIVAAAQEERFTRIKHDHELPVNAINYCLKEAGITAQQLDYIVFYDKPLIKFERILQTYFATAPHGFLSFIKAMPVWLKEKLWTPDIISKKLECPDVPILFTEHHESHAASAFFPSGFDRAAILTADGVGEWATTSLGIGNGNRISLTHEIQFPHSLGLLYSAFTYYTGFKVNSGEYKVMGLAPYGEPRYAQKILDELIDLKVDGSFRLNMKYFNYMAGLTMTNRHFDHLFGGKARKPESQLTQREMDLAASIQAVTEEVMLRITTHLQKSTGEENLCLAGGVALNCVANGKILAKAPFKNIFIQPAAGDAGGALGAALFVWYQYLNNPRSGLIPPTSDYQKGTFLGPIYSEAESLSQLAPFKTQFTKLSREELIQKTAQLLADGNIIGLCQGRMEFGPRALGGRSIIGDPRVPDMQKRMNLKIKYRESFRPFAPSVLAEKCSAIFDLAQSSPYMLLVAPVKEEHRIPMSEEQNKLFGIDKLNIPRSLYPSITHVDYSARIQTVAREQNPFYYDLISAFNKLTDCPTLINTSFNVRGEPIICSPADAYRCFMRTEMDYLVIGESLLLSKKDQPVWVEKTEWMKKFTLD